MPGHGRAGVLEGAGDRGVGAAEHVGRLAGAEAEHVAEDQGSALAGRQQLQSGDEGQGDRLAGLITRLGAGLAVGDAVQQEVGVGLLPRILYAAAGTGPEGRKNGQHHPGRAHGIGDGQAGEDKYYSHDDETLVAGEAAVPSAQSEPIPVRLPGRARKRYGRQAHRPVRFKRPLSQDAGESVSEPCSVPPASVIPGDKELRGHGPGARSDQSARQPAREK